MKKLKICIIGLGPWGLAVLERIISRSSFNRKIAISVDIIEPGEPGAGVHYTNLPDYLLLNTKCGHISMFIENQFSDIENPVSGPTLLEWVKEKGYRLSNDGYRLTTDGGREISPEDFIPRRLLGEYLNWFYYNILNRIPDNISIKTHKQTAINISKTPSDRESVSLDNGDIITSDYIFLTTGHTKDALRKTADSIATDINSRHINIEYPLDKHLSEINKNDRIGISGFGLAAIDTLTALTIGRGGKYVFDVEAGRKQYVSGGLEPTIYMFSRTGVPRCARPAISKSVNNFGYDARFFTVKKIDEIRKKSRSKDGKFRLDFISDFLPLLWDEMKLVYYETFIRLTQGDNAANVTALFLVDAWNKGNFDAKINILANKHGSFNPEQYFLHPIPETLLNSTEYEDIFSGLIRDDLAEAYKGELNSPTKAALELLRVIRETIRYAVDFGDLSPESFVQFKKLIAPMINRIIVGPPKERSEELLALIEAGIVNIPFGPSPSISDDSESGRIKIHSTSLKTEYTEIVDKVVHAYIPHSTVKNSLSPLLSNLYKNGRLLDYCVIENAPGGVNINEDLHPVNIHGTIETNIYVLGPLNEGVKYFNHYIPSPTSRFRAFRDADNCVLHIFKDFTAKIKISRENKISNLRASLAQPEILSET